MKHHRVKNLMHAIDRTAVFHLSVCVAVISLVSFVIKTVPLLTYQINNSFGELALWAWGVLFASIFGNILMRELPKTIQLLLKINFIVFAIYLAFPATLPSTIDLNAFEKSRLLHSHLILPPLCLLGLWRPSLGALGMLGAMWQRDSLSSIFGASLSQTEFWPLPELVLFLVISAGIANRLSCAKYTSAAFKLLPIEVKNRSISMTFLEKMAIVAIAIHFSNYFWSGVKKLFLGENLFSWVLMNETWNLTLVADIMGQLPIAFNPDLTSTAILLAQKYVVYLNLFTIITQLAAIFAGFKVKQMIWLTLLFDISHIGIWLLSGIFFYKWIILNLAIVVALAHIREKIIPKEMTIIFVGMVFCAPALFFVAALGWWDTRAYNHEQFFAITNDGKEYAIPTNYWGSFSVHYAQSRRIRDKSDGFWPTGTSAIIFGQDNMIKANECNFKLPSPDEKDIVDKVFSTDENPVTNHVRLHHQYIIENVDSDGLINYDLHPHHIPSNPINFREFSALDKRTIIAYRYVNEAICIKFNNGKVNYSVRRANSHVITL